MCPPIPLGLVILHLLVVFFIIIWKLFVKKGYFVFLSLFSAFILNGDCIQLCWTANNLGQYCYMIRDNVSFIAFCRFCMHRFSTSFKSIFWSFLFAFCWCLWDRSKPLQIWDKEGMVFSNCPKPTCLKLTTRVWEWRTQCLTRESMAWFQLVVLFSLDNVVVDTTGTHEGSFQFFLLFPLLFSNPEFLLAGSWIWWWHMTAPLVCFILIDVIMMYFPVCQNSLEHNCLWLAVQNGHIKRCTDEDIQSSALELMATNVSTNYISCPADPQQSLGIKLPFLVLIVKNMKKYFTFEVQILDDKNVRRRFRASNYQASAFKLLH